LELKMGQNMLNIETSQLTTSINVYSIEGYDDLTGHWISETAAKLKHISLLPNSNEFDPMQQISRYDFVVYSKPFLGLVPSQSLTQIDIVDLDKNDANFNYINELVTANVISINDKNMFYPHRPMKRIEALAAIIKYSLLHNNDHLDKANTDTFPFWDVPETHWGRTYIELALSNNWISKGHNFYPEKTITKDQLIALLSKTKFANTQIKSYFNHD
jgi:hypothetical protein